MKQNSLRNLGFDLVRATEAAATNAGRYMGLGQRQETDEKTTDAMRQALDSLEMQGHIIIGEEVKLGEASLLGQGQTVGSGEGPELDVVVDPVDGRRLLAQGEGGAISVAAIGPRHSLWAPHPAIYMQKIVVDRDVAGSLVPETLDAPVPWTLSLIARAKNKEVPDLVVFLLNRSRHEPLIDEIRSVGARVMLRSEGDIAGALLAAHGTVDVMMGTGGVPEGVIAACAVKALGGAMLGRLDPQDDEEQTAIEEAELDLDRILTGDDIVSSDKIFFAATGITTGPLLDGVVYQGQRVKTHSLLLRGETQARRFIHGEHCSDWAPTPEGESEA